MGIMVSTDADMLCYSMLTLKFYESHALITGAGPKQFSWEVYSKGQLANTIFLLNS